MKRVILIHGWQGQPGNHWKGWLRKKLEAQGIDVVEPIMPNESNQPADWINRLVEVMGISGEKTVLIGHSLGCPAIIGYLMGLMGKEKFLGAIFVAGFSSKLHGYDDLSLWDFDPEEVKKARKHCEKFISIVSDDDSAVPLEKSRELNELVGGEFILEHNKGHFCEEDGARELESVYDAVVDIFSQK